MVQDYMAKNDMLATPKRNIKGICLFLPSVWVIYIPISMGMTTENVIFGITYLEASENLTTNLDS